MFSHYRPRVVTLLVLGAVTAVIVLANLSDDIRRRGGNTDLTFIFTDDLPEALAKLPFDARAAPDREGVSGCWTMSYGWPFLWRQFIFVLTPGPSGGIGWQHSAGRLAANIAIWLVILSAAGGACEWLLRRYRPRLRWSLRIMLVAVGLAAALCGWFAVARERANVQDPLIASHGYLWLEQWGPGWLRLVGADRYCRRIVGASLTVAAPDDRHDGKVEEFLKRLPRLRNLRYLFVGVEHLTPRMDEAFTRALRDAPQLRVLSIEGSPSVDHTDEERVSRGCLAAIGQLTELEHLSLERVRLDGDDLACLAGLTKLKTLRLDNVQPYPRSQEAHLLRALPELPRLQTLDLESSDVRDGDIRFLSVLRRLKSLNLRYSKVTSAGLAQLASLASLEKLRFNGDIVMGAGLESLRRSNPGIVIAQGGENDWYASRMIPSEYHTIYDLHPGSAPVFLRLWTEGNGELQRLNRAGWRRGR